MIIRAAIDTTKYHLDGVSSRSLQTLVMLFLHLVTTSHAVVDRLGSVRCSSLLLSSKNVPQSSIEPSSQVR
jgi:hypothetical protein